MSLLFTHIANSKPPSKPNTVKTVKFDDGRYLMVTCEASLRSDLFDQLGQAIKASVCVYDRNSKVYLYIANDACYINVYTQHPHEVYNVIAWVLWFYEHEPESVYKMLELARERV